MITMEVFTLARSMPRVVLDSTDHLDGIRALRRVVAEMGRADDMSLPKYPA
jgi:hypothetical protein